MGNEKGNKEGKGKSKKLKLKGNGKENKMYMLKEKEKQWYVLCIENKGMGEICRGVFRQKRAEELGPVGRRYLVPPALQWCLPPRLLQPQPQ